MKFEYLKEKWKLLCFVLHLFLFILICFGFFYVRIYNWELKKRNLPRRYIKYSLQSMVLQTPMRPTTPASRFLHATFLARYATLLARYATLFARYDTLLARYATLLARYDTLLARYATFLTRYASCTLFWCSRTHWGLYLLETGINP